MSVTPADLAVGTEIYYTGDMANQPATGKVVEIRHSDKWGDDYMVEMTSDDGHVWHHCAKLSQFQPAPGRRFWPMNEWRADREARIAEARKQWSKA